MTSKKDAVSASEKIKVVVRCRPLSKDELDQNYKSVVTVEKAAKAVMTTPPGKDWRSFAHPLQFTFDDVFSPESTQQEVYDVAAAPIVQNVLDGYNGTILVYGQAGTGKTFTTEGNPEQKGIIPNSFAQIFRSIAEAPAGQRYLVRCSYLEICNENIRDLLSNNPRQFLELRENRDREVFVQDLTSRVVANAEDLDRVMTIGNKNKAVSSTNMFSRSHTIFSIVVECSTNTAGPSRNPSLRMGKLNLVDLAGSERVRKTLATAGRLKKEAPKLDLSLCALGVVINALVDGNRYIPYRNSKLTRLLQESLGGSSKTVMIATIGPADFHYDESVRTLRYANRAKNIHNCGLIWTDPNEALFRRYELEISELRAYLEERKAGGQQRSQGQSSQPIKPTAATEEAMNNNVLQEQKQMEQKSKEELKVMLEPYGANPAAPPQEIKDELEKRHAALVQDGNVAKREKERLYEYLEQARSPMTNSKHQSKELFHRIMSRESELLHYEEIKKTAKTKEKEWAEKNIREQSNELKTELKRLREEIEKTRAKQFKWSSRLSDHDDHAAPVVKKEREKLFQELQQVSDAMTNSKRQCKELFHQVMSLESELLNANLELKTKEKELAEQSIREASLRRALELQKIGS